MPIIDLNCDMGEGFANDAELMRYISSANVACGFHAGDRQTMQWTIELAIKFNVAVGAHPGYPDRENFGRRPITMSPNEVFDITLEQIRSIREICKSLDCKLNHVKPHGALYNQAASNPELAAAIAEAVKTSDEKLILYGLAG
ncbi:MAG: LamB/YcsF family protein, partial [Acidobacteria bacterium]|nr:LamB/YcsF family protein [Acidobacteriota bacterium]